MINTSKTSVSSIINGLEVILSSLDKAKHFAMNSASNSRLDDKHHPLPDFPHIAEHKHCDISTSTREVFNLRRLLIHKTTAVLKILDPELSTIFTRLFNCCLKNKCFPSI